MSHGKPEKLSYMPLWPGNGHVVELAAKTARPDDRWIYPGRPKFCSGALLHNWENGLQKWKRVRCNGDVDMTTHGWPTALCFSCEQMERENREELEARKMQGTGKGTKYEQD